VRRSAGTSQRQISRNSTLIGYNFVAHRLGFDAAHSPNAVNRFSLPVVQKIEVSDDVFAALQDLATGFHRTPDEVLAALLNIPTASPEAAEPLAAFIVSAGFRAQYTDADRYLGVLSWIAERHPGEFGEFIRVQSGGRRFIGMTRDEIVAACRHNQARQIDGTPYWAIMNLDTASKRRFLARVLEFIGYREVVIEFACRAIGMRGARRLRGLALVA